MDIVRSADPNPADGVAGTPGFSEPPFRAEDIVVHTVGLRGRFRVERCFPMGCGRWGVQMVEVGGPHAGTMFAASARALRLATPEETWAAYEARREQAAGERGAAPKSGTAPTPQRGRGTLTDECMRALVRTNGLMLGPPTW